MLWVLAMLACGGQETTNDTAKQDTGTKDACDTGYAVTWDNWAHGFLTTYCLSCHSENTNDRHDAPEGLNFDTEEMVDQWKAPIYNATITQETMPVGGGVYEEDLILFESYLRCVLGHEGGGINNDTDADSGMD